MGHRTHSHRILRARWCRAGLPAALACLLLLSTTPAAAEQAVLGRITGRILAAPDGTNFSAIKVVLVQFGLDAKGVPQGSSLQTIMVDSDGSYAFDDVPIDPQTVYQIGARLNDTMLGSEAFTFPKGERKVMMNLRVPGLLTDPSRLRIDEGLIVVEPRSGAVWITEVLHLVNPTGEVIEGVTRPLELTVPREAEALEMLQQVRQGDDPERLGAKLLVYGNLPPGRTTVAFRYRLPVALGEVALEKRYPHPIGVLSVLAPLGNLELDSGAFERQEAQEIEGRRYDAWAARDIEARTRIHVRLTGVPTRQKVYLYPLAGFFLLMAGIVTWFVRKRLAGAGESYSR